MLKKIRYKAVFNRSGRLNKRGEGLVQIECSQGKRRIYFSTNVYVKPERYKDGFIIGDNADGLNYAVYNTMVGIERIELDFIKKGTEVSLPMLKEAVRSNLSPAATLMAFGLEVIGQFDRADIDAKITFHSSRHTCATLLGQKGVDIVTVQKILGHTKLETTQIYREVDRTTLLNSLTKKAS